MSHEPLIAHQLSSNLRLRAASNRSFGGRAIRLSNTGKCPRQTWYKIYEAELAETEAPSQLARYELGHEGHARVREEILKAGRRLTRVEDFVSLPVRTADGAVWDIPGHIDGIFEDRYVLEIKTISKYGFLKVAGALKVHSEDPAVSPEHIAQVSAYMEAVGLEEGLLLYRCVEMGEELEAIENYPYFEVVVRKGFDASGYWKEFLSRNEIPEIPYVPVDEVRRGNPTGRKILPYPCKLCPFKRACWPRLVWDEAAAKAFPFPNRYVYVVE